MKQIWKKLGSVLLTLCMVLTLLPTAAFAADDASTLASTINAIEGLDAVASSDGSTVTVTNTDGQSTATLDSTLYLDISSGVTVLWKASATAAENNGATLFVLSGDGTFEVTDDGYLSTARNTVISTQTCPIVVSGGIVSCDSSRTMIIDNAISTAKSITVNGGTVRSTNRGHAIYVNGNDVSVTVTGGSVENWGNGYAITCPSFSNQRENVEIAVSGGTVSSVNGYAIHMIADLNSSITVSGTAEVKATGSGEAIHSNADITVSGGTVSATTGNAICAMGTAVEVSGGTVRATTGYAIWAQETYSTVTVTGGTVFAGGTAISGENNVIYLRDVTDGFTAPTDPGVVIAWNQDAGTTQYNNSSSDNLIFSPLGATVKWAKQGDQSGISYLNSTNTGFLAVDGVTVVKPSVTTTELSFADLSTLSLTYTGSAQDIGTVSAASGISLGAITLYYTGISGTSYAKNTTAPTNAGTYQVSVDVAESDDYAATSGLVLGSYTIAKAVAPTLTWSTAAGITYGASLSDSALSGGSTGYGAFAWTNGTVVPDAGNSGYEVTFTPSASTLQNYETITDTTNTVTVAVAKASATSLAKTYLVLTNSAQSYSFDLTTLLSAGVDASQVSAYAYVTHSDINGIFNGTPSVSGTTLTLPVASVGTSGLSDTVTIGFTSDNFNIPGAVVTVETTDKTPVTITASMTGGVYNVQPYAYSNAAVTMNTDNSNVTDSVTLESSYEGISGTTYGPSSDAPTNAGSYQLTLSAPDSDATYTGSAAFPFTIEKRPVSVKADNKSMTKGGTPPALTYTLDGQLSGETALIREPALNCPADGTAAGSFDITVFMMGTTYNDNYKAADPAYVNGTLTVNNLSTGGDTGGGSSTPATPAPTVSGSTATTTVTAKTGSDGKAAASVTQSQVNSAIEKAQKAAKSNGEAPRVEIQVSGASGASTTETTLPKTAVQALVTGEMEALTLSSPVADMTFDAKAIAAIAGAASGDVAFTVSNVKNSTLSGAAQQLVGDRPVYNLSVTSGGSTISQFEGTVTVSLPYTPAAGEDTNAIVSYYINATGEPELMQNCRYDAKAGTLVFTTTHFSQYAVGYNKVAFSDVSDTAWYADAVSYLAARGITGGTTETTFGPDATLTRGQFITLLLRAYEIDADSSTADNFADAGNTYYTGYLAAAKRLGISGGVGDNKFAPEQAITRQEMFTLIYNALKVMDELPKGDSDKVLSDFTDSDSVSSYAQEAMVYLVKTDIVGGSNGQLSPTDTTTRAQMAQVLYNLLGK